MRELTKNVRFLKIKNLTNLGKAERFRCTNVPQSHTSKLLVGNKATANALTSELGDLAITFFGKGETTAHVTNFCLNKKICTEQSLFRCVQFKCIYLRVNHLQTVRI